MSLDQVVSGSGTTNQITRNLGKWNAFGIDNQTHEWLPLTDEGLAAPVVVSLNGIGTLRISTSTGDCYPNYFMLVPASGIKVTASKVGPSAVISFPTQAGVVYTLFYRNDLTAGNWNVLTTVLGDGTVKSTNTPATAAVQFYRILAP